MQDTAVNRIVSLIRGLEIILATIIIIAVIINAAAFFKDIYQMHIVGEERTFLIFEALVADVLLLVIGLELSIMLIKHSPIVVLDVMLFAVARKLIIFTEQPYEMLLGVLAIIGIFAIKKYLFHPDK